MSELINNELTDILNDIVPDEDIFFFNDDESFDIYQTCLHLMEEFIHYNPTIISEPDFEESFDENIEELMHSHFDSDIFYTEEAQEEMEEIIAHAKQEFFKEIIPPRSYPDTIILQQPDHAYINEQLIVLRNKPQPTQRTKEWYEFRHNLITASNAYKAFENQSTQNQLIYEKCQPLNQHLYIKENDDDDDDEKVEIIKEVIMVNTNTTLHWGQKYEPLSVLIYEYTYQTTIEDFGCIQHETCLCIGASPDGINIDPLSDRYGRMLEIKNIVNREINGIPKKEYWIQMQLQMEVCDLDECDFLETKFVEYPDKESYYNDIIDETFEDESGFEFKNTSLSKESKMKGEIIYFHTKEGKPLYIYKPLDVIHPLDINDWFEKQIDHYTCKSTFNYTFMKTIYWKLEEVSCVLVCRNRKWFNDNMIGLENVWKIIETERVTGYEHRAPNRRQKKEITNTQNDVSSSSSSSSSSGCLLYFNKINVIKKE